jgi:hypothetical protein
VSRSLQNRTSREAVQFSLFKPNANEMYKSHDFPRKATLLNELLTNVANK